MVKADVRTTSNGYTVWATITDQNGDCDHMPLKCFGWYKSAAIEFRDFINSNNMEADKLERSVKLWAHNYDPTVLYTYPEINEKKTMIKLRKQ